jgi:hypothetical protein
MAVWANRNLAKAKRVSVKKAIHPLDPAFGDNAEIAPAPEEFTEELEEDVPACVTHKIAGQPPQTDSELWTQLFNNDTSSIKQEEFGVVAVSRDGTRSELRPNGTLVSYNRDGSIKSFRVAPQAQQDL